MRLDVSYTPYTTYLKEKPGDITKLSQSEEGNIWSETSDNSESGDKSDNNSIIPPLLTKEEMDTMDYGDESEDKPMSTDMLEDIRDGSQYHTNVNRREARYKIHDSQ